MVYNNRSSVVVEIIIHQTAIVLEKNINMIIDHKKISDKSY